MKKIKKLILIVFMFIIGLSLVACGNDETRVNEIHNKSYNYELTTITELENAIEIVAEKCKPAVLGVTAYTKKPFSLIYEQSSTGSGAVYNASARMKDGTIVEDISTTIDSDDVETYQYYLVTNRHCVEKADKLKIYDGDEDIELECELKAYDDKIDLAVIYFEYTKYIQPLTFADSNELRAGQFVIAIGHPYGYDYYGSVSLGVVSAAKRYLKDDTDNDGTYDWDAEYIQHTAPINSGNSGGPLLNLEGKIIGINTLKIADSDADNMGFAIPSNVVYNDVEILAAGSSPKRVTLGVTGVEVRTLTDEGKAEYEIPADMNNGFLITTVGDGAAKNAGLEVGDVILKLDGRDIRYTYEIKMILNNYTENSGDTASVYVYRKGEYKVFTLTF